METEALGEHKSVLVRVTFHFLPVMHYYYLFLLAFFSGPSLALVHLTHVFNFPTVP